MNEPLQALEIETGADPRAAVVWLHGLGADGYDFAPLVEELDLSGLAPLRFVFPHAPHRPVTINGGYVMRAWYDIVSLDFHGRREDEGGVRASAELVSALLARENARGIDDARIVLAGFSQGGAIALHLGLRHPRALAGLIALSTYLPLADTLAAEADPANAATALFYAHGREDEVIPLSAAQRSRAQLEQAGYRVRWHEYPMGHGVHPAEIGAIGAFLREVLQPTTR